MFQEGAEQGADSRRPGADDEHRIFFGNLRDTGSPKARGKHIAYKQGLFVAHRVRYAVQALVGIGHAHVFRLTAVDAASQGPTAVGVGAIVHIAVPAKEALAAEGFHVHRDPVAGADGGDVGAYLLYNAHHFVPNRCSGHGARHATVLDVQVAGADATERHADDGVSGVFEPGNRLL